MQKNKKKKKKRKKSKKSKIMILMFELLIGLYSKFTNTKPVSFENVDGTLSIRNYFDVLFIFLILGKFGNYYPQ